MIGWVFVLTNNKACTSIKLSVETKTRPITNRLCNGSICFDGQFYWGTLYIVSCVFTYDEDFWLWFLDNIYSRWSWCLFVLILLRRFLILDFTSDQVLISVLLPRSVWREKREGRLEASNWQHFLRYPADYENNVFKATIVNCLKDGNRFCLAGK